MFVRELRVTYEARSDLPAIDAEQILSVPSHTVAYLTPLLQNEPAEVFVVVCLSTSRESGFMTSAGTRSRPPTEVMTPVVGTLGRPEGLHYYWLFFYRLLFAAATIRPQDKSFAVV